MNQSASFTRGGQPSKRAKPDRQATASNCQPQLKMNGLPIDQLPDLCLRRIFSCLGWRDLVRCRAVCRLFKLYAEQTEKHELAVNLYFGGREKYWHLTDRPIESKDEISWTTFLTLNSLKFKLGEFQLKLLQQVKFLCVYPPNRAMYTDLLNDFKQLIHLEIKNNHGAPIRFYGARKLELPNLRVLDLSHIILDPPLLDTPKLEVLRNQEIEKLQLKYPEAIKKLESNYPDAFTMAKFKNLEVFTCHLCTAADLDGDLLSTWNHLKELNIASFLRHSDFYMYRPQYEAFSSSLGHILDQRMILEREDLKIYWKNVLLLDASQLKDYDSMTGFFNSKLKYYDLRSITYKGDVNYNDLIGLIGRPDSDFFETFPSIHTVNVTGVVDRDQLEWFLEKTRNLRKLTLTNTSLGQEFFDHLPNLAGLNRRLTHLQITEIPSPFTNFQFILNFDRLIEFQINLRPGEADRN